MRRRLVPVEAMLAAGLLAVAACSQPNGPADGMDLAPNDLARVAVDTAAPDFRLQNIDGRQVMLSSFRGKQHVVLVFYRGYW